ncbi:hypothetical protein V494_00043 [Pseudogymnoascus sp. VKM F-4513 (FW-928)]|nr:hypothetical protein V494_00043 [Pseudogymnoascus sp. VKM F-4513 (FW-928)]
MYNDTDMIGQAHMRAGTGVDLSPSGYEEQAEKGNCYNLLKINRQRSALHEKVTVPGIRGTGRDPFTHPKETGSDLRPCKKQEQGQDQQDKGQSKSSLDPGPRNRVRSPPRTHPFQTPSCLPSQEQGQDQHAKDSASTVFRPVAQEQAAIGIEWQTEVAKIRVT